MAYNTLLESLNEYNELVLNQSRPIVDRKTPILKEASYSEVDLVNMIVGATNNDMDSLRKGLEKLSKQTLKKLYNGCMVKDKQIFSEDELDETSEENDENDENDESKEVEYDANGLAQPVERKQ
jgi:hypothetical protein